jgi:acid phosphatase family membrane protein YuiD
MIWWNVVFFATFNNGTNGLSWENLAQIISPYLLAAALGYLVAQVAKVIVSAVKYRSFRWREFLKSGGMPSSHSATAVALTTVIGLTDGFGSPLFGLAAVFTLIVMYDATHVRRATGEQGEVLRKLIERDYKQEGAITDIARKTGAGDDKTRTKLPKPYFSRGHTPAQAIVGAVVGVMIGVIVYLSSL